jgi:cell division septum initiation protein DivIVA
MQQAPAASNETRLPRAVLRRSQAVEARIAAQREPKPEPAEGETPPAQPDVAPAAPPADPKPPAAAAGDPRESDPLYWKQRFNVVSGVLRTERETHQTEVRGLYQQIDELEGKLAEAEAKVTESPSSSKTDPGKYFTPEQIEQIGEEEATAIAATAERAAREAAQAAVEKVVKPLQAREQRQASEEVKSQKRAFTDQLAELVPNYVEIDKTEGWQEWLAEFDDVLGEQRQEKLTRLTTKLNAVGVSKMFNEYLKTLERPAPPITPHGEGANTGGEPPSQPDVRAVTAPSDKEVKDFFKRAALGKVTAQERVEFEARRKLRAGRPIA